MNIIGSSEEHCYESNKPHVYYYGANIIQTVEPPNNGHGGDEHFVHCSEVEMYGQLMAGASSLFHCREVVLLLECPLSEVLLYFVHALFMTFLYTRLKNQS